jgi:hypothetical protein
MLIRKLINSILQYLVYVRPRDKMDPRFASAVETDHTQGLTNDDIAGLRSNLRKSILFI